MSRVFAAPLPGGHGAPRGASARVGIVGAGQLTRMTQQAAIKLGVELVALAADPADPAAVACGSVRHGAPDDLDALRALAAECHVLTFDHERIPYEHLLALEREGVALRPGARAKRFGQDKLHARRILGQEGYPVPEFTPLDDLGAATALGERQGWPLVLKARRGGYDGRGVRLADREQLHRDHPQLAGEWMAEERIPIEREVSQLVARGADGSSVAYPLVQTLQRDGICAETLAPAPVPHGLARRCRELAERVAARIDAVGILAVELFLTPGGEPVINELALRPHNSGHLTIEGCETSQFENHLRAILGWPLGPTGLRAPAVAMANVLGTAEHDPARSLPQALRVVGAHPHLYGKQARAGRKLGHVTALGPDAPAASAAARAAARILSEGTA